MRRGNGACSFIAIIRTLLFFLSLTSFAAATESGAPKAASSAAEADNEVVDRRICKKEQDERVMEILPTKKGCVLQYTKGGKTEEKAKSVRNVEVCQTAMKKIADRLAKAGYKCE